MKSRKKILFVTDPIQTLKVESDTSILLTQTGLRRGFECFWAEDKDIFLFGDGQVGVFCARARVSSGEFPVRLEARAEKNCLDFDVIFIRKNPPFDASYLRLCWLLKLVEKKVKVLNSPSVLLELHEKLIPYQAVGEGYLRAPDVIPVFDDPRSKRFTAFFRKYGKKGLIEKPFLGFGGDRVKKIFNLPLKSSDMIFQPFQPAIKHGDFRVFFLEGRILDFFARIPPPGGYISNLARGGTMEKKKLSPSQKKVLARIGRFLVDKNIFFAGVDLIGTKISEVNITSPTGLKAIQRVSGIDYSENLIEASLK